MENPADAKDSALIHSVSIAEFDIKIGVTLSHVHPPSRLDSFSKSEIASLCLPDGGHKVKEDWTYMIFNDPDTNQRVFGLSFFRNIPDPSQPRGARQMAMLLMLKQPYFLLFKPMVQEALERFMDDHEVTAPKIVYETLVAGLTQSVQINLFDKQFILNIPSLRTDPFPGASLSSFVRLFKENTLLLWYAAMLGQRILCVSSHGEGAGNACLTIPLLALPMSGYEDIITPYVQLTDLSALEAPSYICGSSNPVMADMKHLYDVVAFADTGEVRHKTFPSPYSVQKGLSSKDKSLIKKVLKGMEKTGEGEKWVRRRFLMHTTEILTAIQNGSDLVPLLGDNAKLFENFASSNTRYQRWLEEARAEEERLAGGAGLSEAVRVFKALQEAQDDDTQGATAVQIMKLYYDLDQSLFDVTDMEVIVENGGIGSLCKGLDSSSSQVRKYSINLLSKLAKTLKGQVDIVDLKVLPLIVALLKDKQQSVVVAAAQCLQKITSLRMGAEAVLEGYMKPDTDNSVEQELEQPQEQEQEQPQEQEQEKEEKVDSASASSSNSLLPALISSLENSDEKDDVLRYTLGVSLIQLYKACPEAPTPKLRVDHLLSSSDAMFVDIMTELIDLWGGELPVPVVSADLQNSKRASASANVRASMISLGTGGLTAPSLSGLSADTESSYAPNPQLLRFVSALRGASDHKSEGVGSVINALHKFVTTKRVYAIQAAHMGCVHLLVQEGLLAESAGHVVLWETLADLSATRRGLRDILQSDLLSLCLSAVTTAHRPSMHLLYAACFLESVVQKSGMASHVYGWNIAQLLCDFIVQRCYVPVDEEQEQNAQAATAAASERKDFLLICLPLLRCLKYFYRALESSEAKAAVRQDLVPLGYLLNVDVDLNVADEADFQTVLMSLLCTIGALDPQYLDWIVRARDVAMAAAAAAAAAQEKERADEVEAKRQNTFHIKTTEKPDGGALAAATAGGASVQHTGWLEKQGWNLIWRKRWAAMTASSLLYFKEQSQKSPTGVIPLFGVRVEHAAGKSTFRLFTAKKTYIMRCATAEESATWASKIQELQRKGSAAASRPILSQTSEERRASDLAKDARDQLQGGDAKGPSQDTSDGSGPAASDSSKDEQATAPSVFTDDLRKDPRLRRIGSDSTARIAVAAAGGAQKPGVPVLNFRVEPKASESEVLDRASLANQVLAAAAAEATLAQAGISADADALEATDKVTAIPSFEDARNDENLRRVSLFGNRPGNKHNRQESWTFPGQ